MVHPSLLSAAAGGGGLEPPTKFSERGAWQDLNFERGIAFVTKKKKEGSNFFFRGVAIVTKKLN